MTATLEALSIDSRLATHDSYLSNYTSLTHSHSLPLSLSLKHSFHNTIPLCGSKRDWKNIRLLTWDLAQFLIPALTRSLSLSNLLSLSHTWSVRKWVILVTVIFTLWVKNSTGSERERDGKNWKEGMWKTSAAFQECYNIVTIIIIYMTSWDHYLLSTPTRITDNYRHHQPI